MSDELARTPRLGPLWAVSSGNRIALPLIAAFGSEEQRSTWLPAACTGRSRFCLAVTEPDGGSDVANLTTTAERTSPDLFKVNGQKKWITNGIFADYAVTAVRTGGPGVKGISVLLVPLKAEGVLLKKMRNSGVEASGSTFIDFEDVVVPVANLLGSENEGFKVLMSNFDAERLGLAISGLRVARTCLSEAYTHATSRRTFGKFLIEHDIIRAKFAELARLIEAQHAWHEQLCFEVKTNGYKGISGRIGLAKVQSSLILERACREAQQVFGGLAFSKGGRGGVVEQIARDLRVYVSIHLAFFLPYWLEGLMLTNLQVVGGGSAEILEGQGFKLEMKESARRKEKERAVSKL
ncbi:Acyl-CoA dehydrogenase, domain-containing protein [Cladophialophora immunda]|nr:Acyl-CoA dehydrogenase, domain-containing protein [Cladophialophora immunda]